MSISVRISGKVAEILAAEAEINRCSPSTIAKALLESATEPEALPVMLAGADLEQIEQRAQGRMAKFTHKGRKMSAIELAKLAGVPVGTMRNRLKSGWSVERAISSPSRPKRKHF